MSYQVLARKWRPKTFAELYGQEHVVKALASALSTGRLHHAYLLTGTRGVGKTTIARILAKSLNCVNGVTATPCGVCPACTDIDAGRFVDLLELDAASNTGIDNMREILDNARYAPTVGRYKVYLIDEVHMLSKAAFNSMLKTLEEPPEHVKFVLATTDPQKNPGDGAVALSSVQPEGACTCGDRRATRGDSRRRRHRVRRRQRSVQIARAARGSMRDALSVLDQAIAHGAGEVRADAVRAMLGTVETEHIYRIADALLDADGAAMLEEADAMTARSLSLSSALDELASLFHRIAVAQTVPETTDALQDADSGERYAEALSPEAVQLAYQICVQGRADLALAPDEATGFVMTLLRLLAFEPATRSSNSAELTVVCAAAGASSANRRRTRCAAATRQHRRLPPPHGAERRCQRRDAPAAAGTRLDAARCRDQRLAGVRRGHEAFGHCAATRGADRTQRSGRATKSCWRCRKAPVILTDKAYRRQVQGRLETALGKRVRMRFEFGEASTATAGRAGKTQRSAGTGDHRSGISRRSIRAGRTGALQCQGASRNPSNPTSNAMEEVRA